MSIIINYCCQPTKCWWGDVLWMWLPLKANYLHHLLCVSSTWHGLWVANKIKPIGIIYNHLDFLVSWHLGPSRESSGTFCNGSSLNICWESKLASLLYRMVKWNRLRSANLILAGAIADARRYPMWRQVVHDVESHQPTLCSSIGWCTSHVEYETKLALTRRTGLRVNLLFEARRQA